MYGLELCKALGTGSVVSKDDMSFALVVLLETASTRPIFCAGATSSFGGTGLFATEFRDSRLCTADPRCCDAVALRLCPTIFPLDASPVLVVVGLPTTVAAAVGCSLPSFLAVTVSGLVKVGAEAVSGDFCLRLSSWLC